MMNESMIAPCGLNCAICARALVKDNPCPGCLGGDANKPDFCLNRCKIVKCARRASFPDPYCDQCELFPCEDVMEKEIRYSIAYPMIETPIGNLVYLRRNSMEALLERERTRWTCPDCGNMVCVHTGVCSGCGKAYDMRRL